MEEMMAKNWDAGRITEKWKSYKDDKSIQREGKGINQVLWIPQRRKRFTDQTKSQVNEFAEGSKRMKQVKAADVDHIKEFCQTSMLDGGDSFFNLSSVPDQSSASSGAAAEMQTSS